MISERLDALGKSISELKVQKNNETSNEIAVANLEELVDIIKDSSESLAEELRRYDGELSELQYHDKKLNCQGKATGIKGIYIASKTEKKMNQMRV